jgi:hypothetical protein
MTWTIVIIIRGTVGVLSVNNNETVGVIRDHKHY